MSDTSSAAGVRPDVLEALRNVIDPELGIDVVELGMVGDVELDGGSAVVDLCLTSMSCPFFDLFVDQVRTALSGVGGIEHVAVRFDRRRPWTPERMTEDARSRLEAVGLMPPRVPGHAERDELIQLVRGVLSAPRGTPAREST